MNFTLEKNDHFSAVRKERNFKAIWSIYSIDNLYTKHNLSENAKIVYEGCSAEVKGDLWVDVYAAADSCINDSGDFHHLFVEQFESADSNTYSMVTGS